MALLDLTFGEVSGANGRFYVSEELLPKLQFVREGHFVEDEGAPALRLVGDLQLAEGPVIQATVQIPTPIHEPQIIRAFLDREAVPSPTEYLKAICFEQSHYFPIYFFIQQTTETIDETIELLQSLEARGQIRNKLIERLEKQDEALVIGKLTGSSSATSERKAIVDQIQAQTLSPESFINQPARFLEAITHTSADSFDQNYVFDLMKQHVLPGFQQMSGSTRTYFRKALCHLDLIWYKPRLV